MITKKKKGFNQNSVNSPDQPWVRSRKLLLPNPVGSAVFIFGAKIGLKSTKNMLFCTLFRPMGANRPPLATLLNYQNWAFKKNIVKCKRNFCNQKFFSLKRKRKFRNQKFLSSKRKRKFGNQNFLGLKCKHKFRNQNFLA